MLAPHNVLLEAQARATLVTSDGYASPRVHVHAYGHVYTYTQARATLVTSDGYRETVAQQARAKVNRTTQALANTTPTHAYAKLDGK